MPFCGWIADRMIGRSAAVLVGAFATGALMLLVSPSDGALWSLVLVGFACAVPPGALTSQVGDATPQPARALVFGWYSAGSYLGVTVSLWIAGALRDQTGSPNAPLVFSGVLILAMLPCFAWFRAEARR